MGESEPDRATNMMGSFGYGRCRKNHNFLAVSPVSDGCLEYLSSRDSFRCEVCGCHRNFHDIPPNARTFNTAVSGKERSQWALDGDDSSYKEGHINNEGQDRNHCKGRAHCQTGPCACGNINKLDKHSIHGMAPKPHRGSEVDNGTGHIHITSNQEDKASLDETSSCKQQVTSSSPSSCGGGSDGDDDCDSPCTVMKEVACVRTATGNSEGLEYCTREGMKLDLGQGANVPYASKKPKLSIELEDVLDAGGDGGDVLDAGGGDGGEAMFVVLGNMENKNSARTGPPKAIFAVNNRLPPKEVFPCNSPHLEGSAGAEDEDEDEDEGPPPKLRRSFLKLLQILSPKESLEMQLVCGEWKVLCRACSRLLRVDPLGTSVHNVKQHLRSQLHKLNLEVMLSWAAPSPS